MVTPADLIDRDAAKEVLFRLRLMHPAITVVRAHSGRSRAGAFGHLGPVPDGGEG